MPKYRITAQKDGGPEITVDYFPEKIFDETDQMAKNRFEAFKRNGRYSGQTLKLYKLAEIVISTRNPSA